VAYLGGLNLQREAALGCFGSRSRVRRQRRGSAPTSAGADFGVVPAENNTEGVVARSLDLF
jgi:chorismate mutase/prephenate dehydratase